MMIMLNLRQLGSGSNLLHQVFFVILETGRRCHPAVAEICKCMGISDISAKVIGSTNPINVLHAFIVALRRQKTPEQVALESGLHIDEIRNVYQHGCSKAY